MDMVDRMLGYDQWATGQVLEASQDLTDAQLDQPFDAGLGTLRETLTHMITVVDFWSDQMAGKPRQHRSQVAKPAPKSIAELSDLHARFSPVFAALARRLNDEGRLDETFVDHFGYPQSQGATILQVIHHNAQHRTEARHMLQRLGVSMKIEPDPQEWEYVTQRNPQS